MNIKNLLLITAILLLVALGNWLGEQGVKEVDTRLAEEPGVRQDYYINDVTITALDKRGRPQHRLQASQLSHFTAQAQTRLEKPNLQIYKGNKVEWRITAEEGEIHQEEDEVLLEGNVRLVQGGGETPLRLFTPALRIQTALGRADTDRAVTLIQADNRIDAVGMQIEQESQRLLLLSQVRGRYESLAP
jgi:lipopolysaccharide export system protein LptC